MAKTVTTEETSKPTHDAYTGMLAISLIALIVGGLLLYLDLSQYPDKNPPPAPKPAIRSDK
jgi:hypothetical protein